jgi:membrane associated rhomboid family serine protease
MFSFYFFGSQLEYIFEYLFGGGGTFYFIFLYLSGIVISDLPNLVKHKNNYSYNSLGASGAVSSVIFACILFMPLQDICLYGVLCFPGFILGALYLMYSYFSARQSRDGINHDAHLFGALYGILFCVVIYPDSVRIFLEQMAGWKLF